MSVVTTAVIYVEYAPPKVRDRLEEPLPFDPRGQAFRQLDERDAGGRKSMQSDVYAGGFNYLDGSALEDWFLALPWGCVGAAVLIHDQEGDFRRVVTTPAWNRPDDF